MKTNTHSLRPKVLALLLGATALGTLTPGCACTAAHESTGEYVDDSAITTKVKTALVEDDTVKAREVKVTTYRGAVQLSGFVDTAAQKAQAEVVASRVPGVRSVQNNITVK